MTSLGTIGLAASLASALVSHEIVRTPAGVEPSTAILLVKVSAPNSDALSQADRAQWSRLLAGARQEWPDATPRQRARWTLSLNEFLTVERTLVFRRALVALESGLLVDCRKMVYGDQSLAAWRCLDRHSGSSAAVLTFGSPVHLGALLDELAKDGDDETAARIAELAERGRPVTYVEVNSRRAMVPEAPAGPHDIAKSLADLWDDIPDDGVRLRLARVIVTLSAMAESPPRLGGASGERAPASTLALGMAPPLSLREIPALRGVVPFELELDRRMGLPSLEGPDRSLVEPWLGREGWREPDLSGGSRQVLKRLIFR
jgi:hypothetical protein